MIVDFPEAKRAAQKVLDSILRQQIKQKTPTLNLVARKKLFEGNSMSVTRPDGTREKNEFRIAESRFSIPQKEIPNTTATDMIEKISAAAEDMAGQMERGFFQDLEKSMAETNRQIPGNPGLTPDGILKGLENIWIDFEDDDRSKPVKPSIIASPEAVDQLKKIAAETTPEEKHRYEEKEKVILDKKYKEYMEDLKSRKIID
jgi:hypothetical protein